MALFDRLFAFIQTLLPHHLLSAVVHALARIRLAPIRNVQIGLFSLFTGVDWSEVRRQRMADYAHFNDFFTRELGSGARPPDPDPEAVLSPCDGRISQCGRITNDRILQAKGHSFSLRSLLGNDPGAADFVNGFFHTIYLSPRDYHRVHMPLTGHLQRMVHVPGRLFSVSPSTVRAVPDLFTRNERVICLFDTEHGPMAVVLVGAMLVSSMETVWAGTVTPPRGRRISTGDWSRRDIRLERGEELGRFNMGSTVIVLLGPGAVSTLADYGPDDAVLMGQKLARLR
ncbi:archaetidylserine decarboxylase [Elongatibacter sediminis]|uniref:Phosphatidylserine decarboxylase proenzyme n=1 Tax=Elongatibacter sediminis TaxID=3119006 RepID=A0AAW9RDG1_9GAMM